MKQQPRQQTLFPRTDVHLIFGIAVLLCLVIMSGGMLCETFSSKADVLFSIVGWIIGGYTLTRTVVEVYQDCNRLGWYSRHHTDRMQHLRAAYICTVPGTLAITLMLIGLTL